jgi:FkbM family methyltransferase
MARIAETVHRSLQPLVGFVVLCRWPWPVWRIRGWGNLPIGPASFRFHDIARRKYAWWAHEARLRRWENPVIRELAESLRPGDVFFDVGAHVGAFTLLASRMVGPSGRVVAFEPDPGPRALLERNVVANQAANVTIAPVAVGDRAGTVRFAASGDSIGRVTRSGGVEVRQVTLDGYCAQQGINPTVMKVDIEGGEAAALRGSAVVHTLRELVVEIHEPALREQGINPIALLDQLGPYQLLESAEGGNYGVLARPDQTAPSAVW